MKKCSVCGIEKPLTDFYNDPRRKKPMARCKLCHNKNAGNYYKQSRRFKQTGYTQELYEATLVKQNYTCAICGRHRSDFANDFAADHDHTAGKPRGLLCSNCNRLLGFAKDDPSILAKAIIYLEDYK